MLASHRLAIVFYAACVSQPLPSPTSPIVYRPLTDDIVSFINKADRLIIGQVHRPIWRLLPLAATRLGNAV